MSNYFKFDLKLYDKLDIIYCVVMNKIIFYNKSWYLQRYEKDFFRL